MAGAEIQGLAKAAALLRDRPKEYLFKDAIHPSLQYRKARFGNVFTIFSYFPALRLLVDVESVRKLHLNINRWTDEELLAWKQSYVSECSALAVAAAIFASVGLSSLSLPNIDVVHWSARALLSASMATGILAVTFATYQQTGVGVLNNALEIRMWLSCGKAAQDDEKSDPKVSGSPSQSSPKLTSKTAAMRRRIKYPPPYDSFPLESSIAVQMKIQMPSTLLQLAILLYLTGFGLYLLLAWLENSIPPSLDYRNTFIVYVAVVGFILIYFIILGIFNELDRQECRRDFDLDSPDLKKPDSQRQLKQWLKLIQGLEGFFEDNDDANQTDDLADPSEAQETLRAEVCALRATWRAQRELREMQLVQRTMTRRNYGFRQLSNWLKSTIATGEADIDAGTKQGV